jgi:hypothetical protein
MSSRFIFTDENVVKQMRKDIFRRNFRQHFHIAHDNIKGI